MKEDIECVFQGFGGLGAIYISNIRAAENAELLQELGIRAVLTAARSSILVHSRLSIPYYLYLQAEDHEEYDITQHFDQTFQFIDDARKKTNVLVHCHAGVSRSASIVIAYLIRKYHYSLSEVYSSISRKRRKINPNSGFIQQLQQYARRINPEVEEKSTSNKVHRRSASVQLKKKKESATEEQDKIKNLQYPTAKMALSKKGLVTKSPQFFMKGVETDRTLIEQKIKALREEIMNTSKHRYKNKSPLKSYRNSRIPELSCNRPLSPAATSRMFPKQEKEDANDKEALSTVPSNESQKL